MNYSVHAVTHISDISLKMARRRVANGIASIQHRLSLCRGRQIPQFRKVRVRLKNTAILLTLSALLTACSGPGYYFQAVSGQWKLMHARQDIRSLVKNPGTSEELVQRLETANRILAFAETTLDLPANGSYSTYVELEHDALVWNVVATGEFSLEPKKWCFVVAGCLPYRGFFNQQKARDSLEKLRGKGMDVYLAPVPAYSTLGKFKDPLLSTMLAGSDIRMAAFLFHELAHQRLYVKGDGRFSESYATFVEETGVKAWLESTGRHAELQRWQNLQIAGKDFNSLVIDTRGDLAGLYRSNNSDTKKRGMKAGILQELVQSYDQLKKDKWDDQDYFSEWFTEPLNNARLALYDTYEGGLCAFQDLFTRAGGDMQEFHRLAAQQAGLRKDERSKWLNQSCSAIAPAGKL